MREDYAKIYKRKKEIQQDLHKAWAGAARDKRAEEEAERAAHRHAQMDINRRCAKSNNQQRKITC
jgi:hypothetical protein